MIGKVMKKRLIFTIALTVLAMALSACGSDGKGDDSVENGKDGSAEGVQGDAAGSVQASGTEDGQAPEPDRHHVEITVRDYGTITVELYGEAAPVTVENFLKLAGDGFYDGLTFHRVIKGFMIQGGDPLGNGTGGSDENIKGEFSSNGVENDLSHTRGAISMARAKNKDSASSQFFIVHEDSAYLDGEYACFGYVTDGIEVVDAICEAGLPLVDGNGLVEKASQPVIESVKVID